jgi:PhzF family phenazine biosynthesis protein
MKLDLYRVSAFESNNAGGNPAGVILEADTLTESEMLSIAEEVGFSETAFVMKSSIADFKVRFFTPVDEVDLCGHATIATFNLLRDLGAINKGEFFQETKAGILKLDIQDEIVFMEQKLPIFGEIIDKKELINCFDLDEEDIVDSMPIQVVSTGLRDIILPIRNLGILSNMKANSDLITSISERFDVVGIHAFSIESIDGADAHTRNFAPRYGIDEESATGTSNGALACYLLQHSNISKDGRFKFEQGYSMGSPSKIYANLYIVNGVIESVYVGGSARKI